MAGDLLLAVGEHEPGQVAAVLAADAEIRIDADALEPLAEPVEAGRPGAGRPRPSAGGSSASAAARSRPATADPAGTPPSSVAVFAQVRLVLLEGLRERVACDPSFLARKYT